MAGGVILVIAAAALFFSNSEFLGETIKILLNPKTAEVEPQAELPPQSSFKPPLLEKIEWTLDTWERRRHEIGGEWGELLTWPGRISLEIKNEKNGSHVKSLYEKLSEEGETLWDYRFIFGINIQTREILSGSLAPKDKTAFFIAPKSAPKDSFFAFFPGHFTLFDFDFIGERKVNGVLTHHYESQVTIEHNENLSNPPLAAKGTYGASTDLAIRLWVEPETGVITKYEDEAESFYTDLLSGEKIQSYSEWGDAFDAQTIAAQISKVSTQ